MNVSKLEVARMISTVVAISSIIVLSVTVAAAAAVTVTVTPNIGPPTTPLQVSGAGFPVTTAVDIYFDTTDVALAVTNASGAFSGISIQVPSAAVPGSHWVTAVAEGTSGKAAQESVTVQTNWSQFHYSALHRGRNPYENVITPTTVATIDLDWTFTTGKAITSSPAVVGGIVYVGSQDNNLYAINATTGAQEWKFATGNSIVDSSPAVYNGAVYIGSTDDYLYSINATTGVLNWKFKTGAAINSSPAVVNGTVYIGSTDDSVYAVNASTGVQVWKFTTGNQVLSSPAVSQGIVYVGSYDNSVYAINASTGTQLWKYTTGGKVFSSPMASDGWVFVGSDDANFYCLNARTGTLIWKFAGTTGTEFESSPAGFGGSVYVGSDAGFLYDITGRSGVQVWDLQAVTPVEVSSPSIADGVYYAGIGNNVYAVETIVTATILWVGTTGGTVTATPVVANGVLYVASQDGNLYAFDQNGSTQQKIRPPERPNPASLKPDPNLRTAFAR
jgi:outer membrane protein assembly factor BamB